MCDQSYEVKTYYAISLDPIHIGTGGSRLGRVDLPIVREPGTNLPKIPGTSLSGPARAYTALQTGKYLWKDRNNDEKLSCAGRGGEGGEKHCGILNPACSVCIPYGFSKGTGFSMQGLAQFFDAHILFFPVSSLAGPVWVTSSMALEGLGLQQNFIAPDNAFIPLGDQVKDKERLNFGWLMLEGKRQKNSQEQKQDSKNSQEQEQYFKKLREKLSELENLPEIVKQKAVLIPDSLFPKIVNSNLEIRTSVSIDPKTGTAEEGALFTYEAIPRGTVFRFEITYNSGKTFRVEGKELKTEGNGDIGPSWVKTQVEKGLKLFETLGIGGMGTRGMGRLKILNF